MAQPSRKPAATPQPPPAAAKKLTREQLLKAVEDRLGTELHGTGRYVGPKPEQASGA